MDEVNTAPIEDVAQEEQISPELQMRLDLIDTEIELEALQADIKKERQEIAAIAVKRTLDSRGYGTDLADALLAFRNDESKAPTSTVNAILDRLERHQKQLARKGGSITPATQGTPDPFVAAFQNGPYGQKLPDDFGNKFENALGLPTNARRKK